MDAETCRAWMSKMTTLVGPPREMGNAGEDACEGDSCRDVPLRPPLRSWVPVGEEGEDERWKERTNMRGETRR